MGKNIIILIHIYGAISIFYYFIITKTTKMSNMEFILVWLHNIHPENHPSALWDNNIHTPQDGSKIL